MKTITYEPLYGITSEVDANNKITKYLYDAKGRVIRILDHEGNVIKAFDYHSYNENP